MKAVQACAVAQTCLTGWRVSLIMQGKGLQGVWSPAGVQKVVGDIVASFSFDYAHIVRQDILQTHVKCRQLSCTKTAGSMRHFFYCYVGRETIIVTWHQSHGKPTCSGLYWHRSSPGTVCGGCSAAPSRASACDSCTTRHAGSSPHASAWQDDARVEDVSREEPGMPRRLPVRISRFSFANDTLRLRLRGSAKKNGLRHCVPRCSYPELRAQNDDAFARHRWQSIGNAKHQGGQLPVGRKL